MKRIIYFLCLILYCFFFLLPASKDVETELIGLIPVAELGTLFENKNEIDTVIYHTIDYPVKAKKISKNIIRVQLADDIIFHWDNKTYRIKEDKHLQNIVNHFQEKEEYLVALFLDTTPTLAVVCGYDSNLVIGDLIFLLLDKIVHIPLLPVFQVQWDVFIYGCHYPNGLFTSFHYKRNRTRYYKALEYYLLTSEPVQIPPVQIPP